MIIQSDKLIIIDKINFNLLGDRDPSEPSDSTSEMVEILADSLEILSDILITNLSYRFRCQLDKIFTTVI